jgi:hypothetical protein
MKKKEETKRRKNHHEIHGVWVTTREETLEQAACVDPRRLRHASSPTLTEVLALVLNRRFDCPQMVLVTGATRERLKAVMVIARKSQSALRVSSCFGGLDKDKICDFF